jgi:large subunit ribosomal protein L31
VDKQYSCQSYRERLFFRARQDQTSNAEYRTQNMKPDIHPQYTDIKVICSCGNEFSTRSTLSEELHIEVCSACHPFYTGKQKIVDTAGRVDKFRRKYGIS